MSEYKQLLKFIKNLSEKKKKLFKLFQNASFFKKLRYIIFFIMIISLISNSILKGNFLKICIDFTLHPGMLSNFLYSVKSS